jgi:hypothetical protein
VFAAGPDEMLNAPVLRAISVYLVQSAESYS